MIGSILLTAAVCVVALLAGLGVLHIAALLDDRHDRALRRREDVHLARHNNLRAGGWQR